MKKIMFTQQILFCGLLSSSLVMFGMQEQQKIQQVIKANSGSNSPRSESPDRQKISGKDILDEIKAIENEIYEVTNPLVEAIVQNSHIGVDCAVVGGADKSKAQDIDTKVVTIAALVDKTQDTLHEVIQGLGKSHSSDTK